MKKYITLSVLFLSTFFYAQTSGINYQAVLYNPNPEVLPGYSQTNSPLVNKKVCLKFSILDAISALEYQETIETTTDEFGMVNLTIGTGNPIGGYAALFEDIVWDSTSKKLKVDIDVSGNCATFLEISNQFFTAVPFAYASKTAENVSGVVAVANGGTGANTVAGAKTNLGLNNVDNTSDLNKPISTATQTALNLKENAANKSDNVNLGTSTVLFPTQNAVKVYVDNKINSGGAELAIEILRATNAENTLTTNLNSEITRATAAENSKENTVNKSDDVNLGTSTVLFPTQNAVKTYVDNQVTMATPDASTLNKGKIKLAGDLTGTADLPLVKNEAITSAKIANGTIINEDIANATITTAKIDGAISVVNGGTGADLSTSLGYIKHAAIGANFTTVSPIPATDVFGAVRFVNGSPADTTTGNVAVPFGEVTTGLFIDRPSITTTSNGDIFVISGETGANASDNGRTFISTGATGTWNEVTSNQASTDARYVQLSGSTMLGSLAFPTTTKVTIIDAPTSSSDVTNKAYVDSQIASGAPNATTAIIGKVKLAGDLGGPGTTASAPIISDSAITTNKIADANVTEAKIVDSAITSAKILDETISNADIANNTITTSKISGAIAIVNGGTGATTATDALTNLGAEPTINKSTDGTFANSNVNDTKYPTTQAVKTYVDTQVTAATPNASNTVLGKIQLAGDLAGSNDATNPVISNSAITTIKIADANVTNAKLEANAITTDKILDGEVQTADIKDANVTTVKIADANVTNAKLADDAVTSSKILDGTIVVTDLANDAIETSKIKNLNVTTEKINDAAVTTTKIASGGNNKVLVTDNSGVVAWLDTTAFGAVADQVTIEGAGTTLSPFKVKDLGIITAKLADLAVTNAKLAADAVTTDKILDGEVQTADIKDLNVTTTKINDAAVTTTKIADTNVTNAKLDANAITTDKIKDGEVQTADIKDLNITTVKIADANVTNAKLEADAVTSSKILDGTILVDDLADDAIETSKIKNLNVTNAKLGANAITTDKIKDGEVQTADIKDANVTTAKIADANVTTIKIADSNVTNVKLAANAVTTDKILDGTIVVTDLANDAVETSKIKDLNVTTAKIADANVTTAKIAQGAADQVLKTNTAGTGVEWGKLSAANLVGKDLTAADASITVVNGVGATLIDANLKVTDLGITTAKLAASAVTTDKITDANVTEVKLAADAVTSTKIVDGTIATADLGDNSVATNKIIDANVTEAKLATGAVTTLKLANDAVTTAKIANGTIINDDIADATITTAKISGTIAIAQGGTGATTAVGALTNLGAEAVANKATATDMGGFNANDVKYPTQLAVKTFVANSLNNGVGNATQDALGLKEDLANKSTAVTLGTSDQLYPSQNAVKSYVDTKLTTTNAIASLTYLPNISNNRILGNTTGATATPQEIPVTGTGDVVLKTSAEINTPTITSPVLNGTISGTAIVPVAQGGAGANMSTTLGYLKQESAGANFTTVSKIPLNDVAGAVKSVNGVTPDATTGNISVALGKVTTGTASLPPSALTSTAVNSDIYVVAGQTTTPNDNGRTYIYDGTNWNEVATNISTTDNRYVRLTGSNMSGDLNFPTGHNVTIVDAPSAGTDVANKTYVDSVVASGAPNATTTATGKIQLAGDLTGTATAPEIGANKVTFAKMQTVSSGVVLGRSSTGTGNIEALTTIPVATLPALTGDVTTSAGSAVTTIAQNAVTLGKIQNLSAQSKLLGTPSTGGLGVAEISLGTGLSMSGGTLSATGGTVTNVTGTTDRITLTNGATTPTVDIASTYAGQSSITTLGTITTGTWNGTTISVPNGGTGATTLTGYVFGNGTNAMTASTTIPVSAVPAAQTIANISTDGTFAGSNDTNYPSQLAVKTYVESKVAAATPDATTTAKGKIQLAGDLTGSATAPVVGTGKITSDKILDGTIATVDIAASAVTTTLIADGTIATADLGANSVTNAKIGETITVANGGTGATTLTGYVKGTGTTAMIASTSIPVADVTGAQTVANLSANIATNTGSISMYPSVAAVETALALKAPLASPALTGTPTAPTAAAGTSTTQIATTEFVASALGSPFFIAAATPTVDALGNKTSAIERSGSIQTSGGSIKSGKSNYIFEMNGNNSNGPVLDLGDSSNSQKFWRMGAYGSINNFDTKNRDFHIFSTNATTGIYFKNDTGRVGIGTNAPSEKFQVNGNIKGDKIIKTGGVASEFLKADGSVDTIAYAPLASPTFTGVPAGPTATAGTNSTQLATTAFVTTAVAAATIADADATTKGKIQLAGDLGGTAAAPLVAKLQGTAVSATAPTTNQLLQYDGTSWKPVSKSAIVTMETEEFTPTASQTSFILTNTPLGKIAMYINGVRVPKAAVSVSGTTVTYVPASNSAYAILVTDRVSFDYIY